MDDNDVASASSSTSEDSDATGADTAAAWRARLAEIARPRPATVGPSSSSPPPPPPAVVVPVRLPRHLQPGGAAPPRARSGPPPPTDPAVAVRAGLLGPLRFRTLVVQLQRMADGGAAAAAEPTGPATRLAMDPRAADLLLAARWADRLRARGGRSHLAATLAAGAGHPPGSAPRLAALLADAPRASWPAAQVSAALEARMRAGWGR
jgi:hypothetical protein